MASDRVDVARLQDGLVPLNASSPGSTALENLQWGFRSSYGQYCAIYCNSEFLDYSSSSRYVLQLYQVSIDRSRPDRVL